MDTDISVRIYTAELDTDTDIIFKKGVGHGERGREKQFTI